MLVFSLFSCGGSNPDLIDPDVGLSRNKTEKVFIKNRKAQEDKKNSLEKSKNSEAPIPTISRMVITPPPPAIGGDKTISFSVTEQVPLRDVLIQLGRIAKIDIDLDPGISGGIIINAKNRPLKEVIDRISSLGNLRYSYRNNVLYFERDTPYLKNYFVDYLIGGQLWTDVESNISSILKASEKSNNQSSENSDSSTVSSNKSAGIISIFATEKQHLMVTKYLKDVEKSASLQVIIEAKVVDVTLNKSFATGVDWNWANSQSSSSFASNTGFVSPAGGGSSPVTLAIHKIAGYSMSATVSALETFGTTRTISSPRIHAINNKKATLNFNDQLIYFKIDNNQNVTVASSASGSPVTTSTITSTKQEEKVGVTLEITPSINASSGEITLNIKPSIRSAGTFVTDPASPTASGSLISGAKNQVPQINTRELETIAKIRSGNIIAIGGLMKESASNSDSGVPFIARIPFFGWFFKSATRSNTMIETVILVKATLVNSGTALDKYDYDIQDKFSASNRSFTD